MIFEVGLNAISSHEVSVTYSTSIEDGDTAEEDDFVDVTGTVTFLPGQDYAEFGVALNDDNVYEGNETFTVTLTNAMNAALPSPSTATGTILDDETEPTISIADASADEGDQLRFEVTLSGPSERNVGFDWDVSVEPGDTATLVQDVDRLDNLFGGLSSGSTRIFLVCLPLMILLLCLRMTRRSR